MSVSWSGILTTHRKNLAAALAPAGLKVFDHVPPGFTPPAIVVALGDPWLTPAGSFGDMTSAYTLQVVAGTATNDVALTALEGHLERVLDTLENTSYVVGPVSAPYLATLNDAMFLTIAVDITTLL